MKVAIIGDIHGTNKFIECYDNILKNDNDVDKIIVLGDHFDPYENISTKEMVDKYHQFIDCCKNDKRIISILGNHDLEGYIIEGGTSRTSKSITDFKTISDEIKKNIPDSYLVYKIGNWLFSHAGVSNSWINMISQYPDKNYPQRILGNFTGWTIEDLDNICSYYYGDYSGYGNHKCQGCTWIRPDALVNDNLVDYNQVIAHTQVKKICNLKDIPEAHLDVNIWMVDNCRKSEYLILNINEDE